MYDAIVIGGGLLGNATAYHLVCQGAQTLLIDRNDQGRATDAGAGILSPETSASESDTWFRFAVAAVDYYPTLLAQLASDNAGETGYARCGKLTVAVSEDELAAFAQANRQIFERQRRRGYPSEKDLYPISSQEARELFPPLAPVYGAIYYRHAARVDGRLLSQAIRRAAEGRGLEIKAASVESLVLQGTAVTGVVVEGETVNARKVAIAGGAWSQAFGLQLGVQIPVEPQRGQIIHLTLPGVETANWPIISAFHGHYMLAWPDNRVAVGASRETGSGFGPHTTVAGVHEVLSEALRVAPGLAQAQIREVRVGLRPYTADHLPVLGAVPGIDNIYLATGHGPTGLQLGPYSGKLVAELMLGRPVETNLRPFSIARFR